MKGRDVEDRRNNPPPNRQVSEWDTLNVPPAGHPDVGKWAWGLYETGLYERDRIEKPKQWEANYKLYRGDYGQSKRKATFTPVPLFFANVERTVSSITARNPSYEVVDEDGESDQGEDVITVRSRIWWKETGQRKKLKSSAKQMEIYGITPEKAFFDEEKGCCDVVVLDPYAFIPAPGNWEDIGRDAPFVCHPYVDSVEAIEAKFGLTRGIVKADDGYSVLGQYRETAQLYRGGSRSGSVSASSNYTSATRSAGLQTQYRVQMGFVVEIWVRDLSPDYPDGVRVITVTNSGDLVIDDKPNPNINHGAIGVGAESTYAWGRFPFWYENSYRDPSTIWGFSAAAQTKDIGDKITELVSKAFNHHIRAMTPPLILPKDTGLTAAHIHNGPGLLIQPSNSNVAGSIRFAEVPSLPPDFYRFLDILIGLHDRTHQIEDADRGEAPSGVIAFRAIKALQDRNAMTLQSKIDAIDTLVEYRGRWAISMWQNFGIREETVKVNGEIVPFRGVDFLGRRFSYSVESGSTMPRTSLEVMELSMQLYQLGAVDRQALLENVNYPNWKEIVERVGEGQLGQALQVLIQAGMPEEQAMMLQQQLMQPQGGPGNMQRDVGVQPGSSQPKIWGM